MAEPAPGRPHGFYDAAEHLVDVEHAGCRPVVLDVIERVPDAVARDPPPLELHVALEVAEPPHQHLGGDAVEDVVLDGHAQPAIVEVVLFGFADPQDVVAHAGFPLRSETPDHAEVAGVVAVILTPFAARIMDKIDMRWTASFSLAAFALS